MSDVQPKTDRYIVTICDTDLPPAHRQHVETVIYAASSAEAKAEVEAMPFMRRGHYRIVSVRHGGI